MNIAHLAFWQASFQTPSKTVDPVLWQAPSQTGLKTVALLQLPSHTLLNIDGLLLG
jgi:hypothetical protein